MIEKFKGNISNNICHHFCRASCVDGSCPAALRDEYSERGYDVINDCDECYFYQGCKDCCFYAEDMCPNFLKDRGCKDA